MCRHHLSAKDKIHLNFVNAQKTAMCAQTRLCSHHTWPLLSEPQHFTCWLIRIAQLCVWIKSKWVSKLGNANKMVCCAQQQTSKLKHDFLLKKEEVRETNKTSNWLTPPTEIANTWGRSGTGAGVSVEYDSNSDEPRPNCRERSKWVIDNVYNSRAAREMKQHYRIVCVRAPAQNLSCGLKCARKLVLKKLIGPNNS